MSNFGVIVVCTKRDYLFAKGCCASIRYFMGNVPICLLVDGDFFYDDLVKTYNASVINKEKVQSPELRRRSYGWGLTKMIAFWESPFDRFLLLDADTCMWGNLNDFAQKLEQFDIIFDKPAYSYSEESISQWFFNAKKIKELFPDFTPDEHPYACSGVILARKNIFSLNEYMDMLDLTEKHPDLFFPGEMGFLNFMVFRAKESGRLNVGSEDIQYLVCDFDAAEMKKTFPVSGKPELTRSPTVLHFTGGIKPIRYNKESVYTEPIIYFRKKYLLDRLGWSGQLADTILKLEDFRWRFRTQFPYYKRKIKQAFRISNSG